MRPAPWLLLVPALACGPSASEERARREALAAEGVALERAADAVEARLLAGEARVAVWSELAARRNAVTEVACRVGDAHFQDMARLFEEQAEKGRGRHRSRAVAEGRPAKDVAPSLRGEGVGGSGPDPATPMGGPRVPIQPD